jgi:hypothetical protein
VRNDYDNDIGDGANADITDLSVLFSGIFPGKNESFEDFRSFRKTDAMLFEIRPIFFRIPLKELSFNNTLCIYTRSSKIWVAFLSVSVSWRLSPIEGTCFSKFYTGLSSHALRSSWSPICGA